METTSRQIHEKLSKPKEQSTTGEPSTVVKVLELLEEKGDKYVRKQGGFASLAQSMQETIKLPPVHTPQKPKVQQQYDTPFSRT